MGTPSFRTRSRVAAALLLAVLAGGCAPPVDSPSDPLAALGARKGDWLEAGASGQAALSLGLWSEAVAHFERRIAMAPMPEPGGSAFEGPLGEAMRQDLYNLACARALSGRTEAALDALEMAMEEGPGAIGFDLLAGDPDLVPLHGEERWKSLLHGLSWNDEVNFFADALPASGKVPVVVQVAEEPRVEDLPSAVQAIPSPTYRTGTATFSWTTRMDPGVRAGEKAILALRRAETRAAVDPERRILRASGAKDVRLAWEILLRHPGEFSRAVLDGPAPPLRLLLDRGAERMGTEILVSSAEGVPDAVLGAKVRSCGSLPAALKEALR